MDVTTSERILDPVQSGTLDRPEEPQGGHHGDGTESPPVSGPVPFQLETQGTKSHRHVQIDLVTPQEVIATALEGTEWQPLAESMRDCGVRRQVFECVNCGRVRISYHHCDLHWCPRCQRKLAARRAEAIEWWAGQVRNPIHVVLTVRNTDRLSRQYLAWFKRCLQKLRRRKICRRWRGGLWSIEITNEGRGWHVHAHLLVDAPYTDAPELARVWGELVGQDFAIVKVQRVRGNDYVREASKYTVKGDDLLRWSHQDVRDYVAATHRARMFGTWGNLRCRNAEWKRYVERTRTAGDPCECGCITWIRWDETEWEWEQYRREAGLPGGRYRPPPRFAA